MSILWLLSTPLVYIAALALWWGLLKLSRRRDDRRLRNGLLLLLLTGSAINALLYLASLIPALSIPVGLGTVAFTFDAGQPLCRSCSCSTASSSSAARAAA